MSKINGKGMDSSMFFKTLFSQLLEYKNFINYVAVLPVETNQMKTKSIIKVSRTFDNQIVSMAEAFTKYVDDDWFEYKMKEGVGRENSLHSYPVKVISTRIDWILNEECGK